MQFKFRGSARNSAHADVGGNNDATDITVQSKRSIGTFGFNKVPTNFNQKIINHVNEVSPNQNMNQNMNGFNKIGLGDESVINVTCLRT